MAPWAAATARWPPPAANQPSVSTPRAAIPPQKTDCHAVGSRISLTPIAEIKTNTMKTIKIWNNDASERQLDQICALIRDGEILIIPTDTLYGIVCDALNPKSIERICRLKGINPDKTNLSIICSDISMASEYSRFDNKSFQLLRDNTPGPFTFLFKTASSLPKAFKGRKTVGVRIPGNKFCLDLVGRLGHPLLTTSIEYDDEDYARNPELIAEAYEGKVDTVILGDDGDTTPSTIIDCTGPAPEIIRQGKGELL